MNTLKEGDRVPDFTSVDQDGNLVKLSDYSGKKLVVFFYPRANTPGCTAEACNLRDNYAELQSKGYELLGVSEDSQKKQAGFRNKYEFPFPLLADEDHTVIKTFGVWGPKKFMGRNVLDGDKNDLRFLDKPNSIVGLIAKGKARHDTSGFVID